MTDEGLSVDRENANVKAIADYLRRQLEKHRRCNDAAQPEAATATLRGRIAEDKHLLSLLDPPKETDS